MRKLKVNYNKILKLNNVLKFKILFDKENFELEMAIQQMETYIRTKGASQIGPLIQFTKAAIKEGGNVNVEIIMMMQCNKYIHNVEYPYSMEATVRVDNTLYCRYEGSEQFLKFAYDKIQLEAYENEIPLKGDSYTIFVGRNEENETIIADVFMERAD